MEVSIPLIQNQVIDHTGTYHIVQRTINGQTGLVIEEYIPEPEPEEEVLQNNSNTRAMIIDENNNENNEENNNNNGQIVLRGQNNVRGLPDPAGETIEGTFEINIPPTPTSNVFYMDYFYVSKSPTALPTGSSVEICARTGWAIATTNSITMPSMSSIIIVHNNNPSISPMISISLLSNNSSFSKTLTQQQGTLPQELGFYYYITSSSSPVFDYLHIRSSNSTTDIGEIIIHDDNEDDYMYNHIYINSNSYAVDFSN